MSNDRKYLISGSDDKTIRIWNLVNKSQEAILEGYTHSVKCLAISYDNAFIVSGSNDKIVRI